MRGSSSSTGEIRPPEKALRFVVQKHAASHLHYDFRLELDGVLKSWAVPKGPSLDPAVRRLAMMVEDHPFDYRDFEGVIPAGNYGAGKVLIWDEGTYAPFEPADRQESERILRRGLAAGDLKFVLYGQKLKGQFALVRTKNDDRSWLLLKKKDQFATTDEVAARDRSVVSGRCLEEIGDTTRKDLRVDPPADAMPRGLKPMLATPVSEPFDDPEWIFEIKLDGYRALAEIAQGKVLLSSRKNLSFNRDFAPIVRSLETVDREAILDGEIVVLDANGRSDFQLLQNYRRTGSGTITYFVFDLLYLDGRDLRGLPLLARKELLREILPDTPDIRYTDHIGETGRDFFVLAQENRLEGIVAKRTDSRYLSGKRTREWLKIKATLRQEAVICGFTAPRGSRKRFGTLILGVYEGEKLAYIGHSGGGFDDAALEEIYGRLLPLVQTQSPFTAEVKPNMPARWVKPVLVAEVAFSEWTAEGLMRQPVFLGLREDKEPRSVTKEEPQPQPTPSGEGEGKKKVAGDEEVSVDGRKLKLTNLNKIFWPEENLTKGDVIEYYRRIAPFILSYLRDRPESLYRTPHGTKEGGFFHKDMGGLPPPWVQTVEIYSGSNEKNINYLVCQDEATLVYMANLGCIEINPWLSRLGSLDYPDYLVIDLDPEDIAFTRVVEAANAVREVLEDAGVSGFPKTSGATGMHIYVPLGARYAYETAGTFARLVATLAQNRAPEFTSIERPPGKRQKKVYLDFLQNRKGQTLAAPYSIRPKAGATVSTPLTWEEVKTGLDPRDFTIRSIFERLDKTGDLFRGVLAPGIDLEKCVERLEKG